MDSRGRCLNNNRRREQSELCVRHVYIIIYSLFGGVSQLIFAAPVVALLDTWIGPQRLNRLDVLRLERRHRLVVDVTYQATVVLHHERRIRSLLRKYTIPLQAAEHDHITLMS